MATRQGLDSSIVNRLGADEQAMFLAIKAEFDSGTVRNILLVRETYKHRVLCRRGSNGCFCTKTNQMTVWCGNQRILTFCRRISECYCTRCNAYAGIPIINSAINRLAD